MIISIGEVLVDIFPGYKRIGGAPFNFAFHLKQLGFPVRFISRIGNDEEGEILAEMLMKYGFESDTLQTDDDFETGKVLVRIDEKGTPDFEILPDAAYDNIEFDNAVQTMLYGTVDLIYIGTLVQRSINGFAAIQHMLNRKRPHTKVLYDINLRPPCYNSTIITESLRHTDILKLNSGELDTLKQTFGTGKSDNAVIDFLFREFSVQLIALTRGEHGSELFRDGQHSVCPAHKLEDTVDTVGAGDGFAAILAAGYLQDWDLDKILTAASSFAGKLCRMEGAIPLDTGFYDKYKRMFA